MMEELCVMDFSQDLDYWMIDDIYLEVRLLTTIYCQDILSHLQACCEGKYSIKKEHIVSEGKKNSKVKAKMSNLIIHMTIHFKNRFIKWKKSKKILVTDAVQRIRDACGTSWKNQTLPFLPK